MFPGRCPKFSMEDSNYFPALDIATHTSLVGWYTCLLVLRELYAERYCLVRQNEGANRLRYPLVQPNEEKSVAH